MHLRYYSRSFIKFIWLQVATSVAANHNDLGLGDG